MTAYAIPEILFEDNHLLVAVKPPGLPSQSGSFAGPDMLGLLKRDLAVRHHKPGEAYLGLVHRLDQPTSGLMVFAKTSKAASRLSEAFRTRAVKKFYLAVTREIPEGLQGVMADSITKKEVDGKVQIWPGPGGYPAELKWILLDKDQVKGEALLLIDLITGRKHQIRAQMEAHKIPLLGDRRYGRGDARDLEVPTVALHACGLSFPHPVRKEPLTFWLPPEINPSFPREAAPIFQAYLEENSSLLL